MPCQRPHLEYLLRMLSGPIERNLRQGLEVHRLHHRLLYVALELYEPVRIYQQVPSYDRREGCPRPRLGGS